jgi:hypothetical protein
MFDIIGVGSILAKLEMKSVVDEALWVEWRVCVLDDCVALGKKKAKQVFAWLI